MKIATIVGARPQFVKAATVSRIIARYNDIREVIIHTGQHYDENMSDIFFRELNIPEPDYNLGVGSGSHAEQTGQMLQGIEKVLIDERPDWTLVYGDTNSTVAAALAAAKLHIPVAHVEAGLRSFNRMMPEEINRIVTDRISDLLFAPTQTAVQNLGTEGLAGITCFSGDVMFDSVLFYLDMLDKKGMKEVMRGLPEKYMLVTIHRAENTDNPENLKQILAAFRRSEHTFVLPVHPRTRKLLNTGFTTPPNLILIEPVGYLQMLLLTRNAVKVLTDSGGLQKEAYFLNRQCITLRIETEWIETLHDNWNTITGPDTEAILRAMEAPVPSSPVLPSFGTGNAASFIVDRLLKS